MIRPNRDARGRADGGVVVSRDVGESAPTWKTGGGCGKGCGKV
jgi:hypothetical protein